MIDQLKSLAIFVAVVDAKSFKAASEKLSLAPSVVSHHVTQLEEKIGAALLYRSTRALSLTREGELLHERASKMVASAHDALGAFSEQAGSTLTELTITVPISFGGHPLFSKLVSFSSAHPGIMLNLKSSDSRRELLKEGFDLAIRMGGIKDSELKVKKIGDEKAILVASPDYLAGRPKVATPEELSGWDFIGFSPVAESLTTQKGDGTKITFWGNTRIRADSISTTKRLALAGGGLANIPATFIEKELAAGDLITVLPGWAGKSIPIYLVWPKNSGRDSATRTFIKHMSE